MIVTPTGLDVNAIPANALCPESVVFDAPVLMLLMLLPEMVPVATLAWSIPAASVDAFVDALVRLAIVLFEITNGAKVVVVMLLFIPYTLDELEDVVANEECKLFEVEVLPMVLFETVIPAVLDTAIPSILAPCVDVPMAVKAPIILLLIFTVAGFGVDELIPTIAPRDPGVRVIAPFPVPAPIVLGLDVPMFALPDVILMPQSAPPDVFEVLVVVITIFLIVFPCTEEGVVFPTLNAIPWNVYEVLPVIV